jgi:hypothetical protein
MSIKKLFESTDTSRNYLAETDQKEAFKDAESAKNAAAISKKQQRFIPQIDYSNPANFVKYGSAQIYYKSAVNRITDYYPYDGSEYEKTEFHNESLDIEEYIFDNLYPRTNGYALLCADGWGSRSSLVAGYGLPSNLEYIAFTGGPHTITSSTTSALFPDATTVTRNYANIYDDDIYTTEGLEADYGSGSRESNLQCDFNRGVTIEFWMKKDAWTYDAEAATSTYKEVMFDLWNGGAHDGANGDHNYGRITLTGDPWQNPTTPLLLTVRSGSTGWNDQPICTTALAASAIANGAWQHYAVTIKNSGSQLVAKLYVSGTLENTTVGNFGTLGELPPKTSTSGALEGRLGALITTVSAGGNPGAAGSAKLSASLDEFRFWKVARTGQEIKDYWFTQVRGGTNTDISNTTLGVYYKFNAGITGTSSIDNAVLDYSGRVSNGNWVGYDSYSRSTNSAIVEASASAFEFKDPIIRSNHPDVISLLSTLQEKGSNYDFNNNAAFKTLVPSWVLEEAEGSQAGELVPTYQNNLEKISHVVGAYFDKLRLQIKSFPSLRYMNYTSASHTPFPFAQHLPQSLGLYMPELFIDSTVMERFMNRDPNKLFDGDLNETKNLIYQNIYNNLTHIFKSKGTEKSIRNVFRCFHLDDKLVRLNVYANNEVFELKDNLRQTLINKKTLNFNTASNVGGVVYQAKDPANGESLGYISGSNGVGLLSDAGETGGNIVQGYEFPYGFTTEADIMFPRYNANDTTFYRDFNEVSLFGMCSASTDNGGARPLNDTTWYPNDAVSFQVYAIKNSKDYKDVFFKLTSSLTPDTTTDLGPFPELTSSYFYDVYDNTNWNLSVRLKPSNFGLTNMVSGAIQSDYNYDLVFSGYNHEYGTIQNSFTLTASISKTAGENFLKSAKRLYVGGRRHNLTGAISASCDVLFNSAKYWAKYLDNLSLREHAFDLDNSGISGSWRDISPLDPNLSPAAGNAAWTAGTAGSSGSVLNPNMLALDWRFNNVSSSDANGAFYVDDHSSGSALLRDNYGWVGKTTGYQHVGSGSNWPASNQNVMVTQSVNAFQFINPEYAASSDMIKILDDDDKYFGIFETPPNYRYVLEKSMYNAISEEMLDFFAGAVDFNNLIGEPVNRYRGHYKRLEKLREIFFRRVKSVGDDDGVATVERFLDYYKWFDDAIAIIVGQMIPASTDFTPDIYNTIESHVLERNKYRSKYPSVKTEYVDPAGSAWGSYEYAASPLPESPRPTNQDADYWKNFADRTDAEITSNNATVDAQRNTIRDIVSSQPTYAEELPTFTTVDGVQYQRPLSTTGKNSFAKVYGEVKSTGNRSGSIIHGGVNFEGNKSLNFTYNALRPGGPVNTDNSVFVPLNVLYADIDDMVPLDEITANVSKAWPQRKLKRVFSRVQHGRDWQNGSGYSNIKSTFAFPFNIMSSSVWTGYNNSVVKRVSASLEIVNLHNDVYGPNMEVPMQGVFTDHNVGGHQSRHVPLNTGSVLDTYLTRPEAWKLLLGKCPNSSGALGMGSPDYPWPEANESDVTPYPMTGSQKAIYYRGYTAKRPVNIRNIIAKTGSTTHLGNYIHNYEVVQAGSSFANPRRFMKQQPELPAPVVTLSNQVVSASTNVVSFYPTLYRTQDSHFDFNLTYAPWQFTGSNNQSTIMSRFGAPGGPDTMSRGFLDIRGAEYSVYNCFSYRNLSVIKPFQASGSISEATGSGVPGIRVSDQTGRDYGLRILLARHSARFGRDSRFETATPGATYNQLPSFQKVNRNTMLIIDSSSSGYASGAQYDNAFVSHQIPRADRQYSWMSATLLYTDDVRLNRFAPTAVATPDWLLGYFSSSTGYIPYFDFVSGTNIETTTGIYQPNTRLNILTIDPVTASATNIIGLPTASDNSNYFNSAFIDVLPAADSALITGSSANYFNLLMARRGYNFGWNWKKVHQGQNPIFQKEISGANISLTKVSPSMALTSYRLTPVSMKGRPVFMNITAPTSSESGLDIADNAFTIKTSDSVYRVGTSNTDLDNYLELPLATLNTPYDALTTVAMDPQYTLNWILYSQGVYPSDYNELYETTFTRTGYSNNFWNNSRVGTPSRASIGGTFNNSFNRTVSQSCWVLDAQENFLTRTKLTLPTPSWNSSSAADDGLINSGAAGELQNNYFFYFDTKFSTGGPLVNADEALAPGALYARKHMLTTPQAVSPWNNIAEVGHGRWNKGEFNSSSMTAAPEPYAGEALWEADTQAGRVIKDAAGLSSFEAHPSKPWFNNYDDFKYEIKLVAKDYSIIPEFRISENIEDYTTYGIMNSSLTDTFTIPGTSFSSSQDDFYKDYSNSEFMKEFINIPAKTNLSASEIKLVMSAAIRFNPYKGFYPAQRTVDIVRQFSKSFGAGLVGKGGAVGLAGGAELFNTSGSLVRPIAQPLFAPGILYNTLKAGVAVDYPVLLDSNTYTRYAWTGSAETTDNWALSFRNGSTLNTTLDQYGGGNWFTQRLPFEAIIEPDKYINGLAFLDCEPHPSCSLTATASWSGEADDIYTKMVSNFFGEIPKFFLADGASTVLESGIITDDLVFEENATYAARVKLLRSSEGTKNYNFEKASDGAGTGWGVLGFTGWSGSAAAGRSLAFSTVPVPQDPVKNPNFKPLFQPYSRPTAFGPPIVGRPDWGNTAADAYKYARQGGEYGVRDSFAGCNPAFTPPYTDGECWFDLVFTPIAGETYDLERIMTETSGVYWRFDPGPERYTATMTKYQNIPACQTGSDDPGPPYGGANINANSMQLSASFNLFGIQEVSKQTTDALGNLIEDTNETIGKRWVIQSKFETPLLNFTDADPVHPITDANDTLTLPVYGDKAVPRGMWHQFGVQPSDADTGIFISIEDIDVNWLTSHYDVINKDTVYNRKNYIAYGTDMYSEMQSLSTLLGFDQATSKKRMGELAEKQTISEAVVAVPYITNSDGKLFVEIPQNRFEAALAENKGTAVGDSLDTAGASIRYLLQKMERYVLPPEFDFINNTDVTPVVMYMFEFEYELDKDDLAYIWQNLAPRNYQKIQLTSTSEAHELIENELLSGDVLQNEDLRWMVFKVKQRGMTNYFDDIIKQSGESSDIADASSTSTGYDLSFNWPYDFVSIVEMAKLDVQVLYKSDTGTTSTDDNHAHTYSMNNNGDGTTSYNDGHIHEIMGGIVQEADGHTHTIENGT